MKGWQRRAPVVFLLFPRQGHYAHAAEVATYPPADITVERIGDLLGYDLPALLQPARAREAR